MDKRREQKTKNEKEEEKIGLKEMKSKIEIKDQEIQKLLKEIDQFKEKVKENDENLEILSKLYESGIIDAEGIPTRNKDDDRDKME